MALVSGGIQINTSVAGLRRLQRLGLIIALVALLYQHNGPTNKIQTYIRFSFS